MASCGSVVIDDFNVVGTIGFPHKTDAPLIIDANAVLAAPIPGQCFKSVTRRCPHCVQRRSGVELLKLADRNTRDVGESLYALAREQLRRVLALKGLDHEAILYRLPVNDKRIRETKVPAPTAQSLLQSSPHPQ
jgi:hypothetical protein